MSRRPCYDVAVVGAGAAGCATAIELCRLGVERVVLFDAGSRPHPVGETIPGDSRVLLEHLGVWEGFDADGHMPCYGSCSSWGSDEPGFNDFVFNPHGPGWHLDRARFDARLARRAEAGGVSLVASRVSSVARSPGGGFEVRTPESVVDTRMVVDATGPAARVARALGAIRRVHDRLGCVAGFFDLPAGHRLNRLTLLEAVESGWWYAALLRDDRAVAVQAADTSVIGSQGSPDPQRWRQALNETGLVGPALAGATLVPGGLVVRSAPSASTRPCAGDGWLAVGDAAAAFDPLSSQGIHQALAGGVAAARAATRWLAGDPSESRRYDHAMRELFAVYLANRRYLYGRERRWAEAPFWLRRRDRDRVAFDEAGDPAR